MCHKLLICRPARGGWEAWCTGLRGGLPGKAWKGQQGLLSGWSPRAHSDPGRWSLRWAGRVQGPSPGPLRSKTGKLKSPRSRTWRRRPQSPPCFMVAGWTRPSGCRGLSSKAPCACGTGALGRFTAWNPATASSFQTVSSGKQAPEGWARPRGGHCLFPSPGSSGPPELT